MARWKCRRCDNRPIREGRRGKTLPCPRCRGEMVCLGRGIDLEMPSEEEIEDYGI